jgi:PAS domain S-box-containing protein
MSPEEAQNVLRENADLSKKAEALEALLAGLMDTIPDYIYFKDRQCRFIRINKAHARHLGLASPDEAVGKTDLDLHDPNHAEKAFADDRRIMETGLPMIGVAEKETQPDGGIVWVSTTKVPLRDERGTVIGLVGISRDITEQKAAETRLSEQNEMLSNSHEGVMIVSLSNAITFWNRGAERLFGWTAAEAIGKTPEQLLKLGNPKIVATLRSATERDGAWSGELRPQGRDGRELLVDCHVTLVRNEAGQPRGRITWFADITEKRRIEEQLLRTQRLENIGVLAAGIAHDLNNILVPIMCSASILRENLSSADDLRVIDTLEKSTQRGADLVRQILGFARGSPGEFQRLDVGRLVADIVAIIAETFPKALKLRHLVAPDIWPAQGNPTQVHQVLLNLCVNARDAMPHGGTLRITAINRLLGDVEAARIPGGRPGAWLLIEVSDTGTGIPPDILEKIWTPFFTTKAEGDGTGLGLSTVRGILYKHNGFIDVSTEVGKGSSFRVFLPAVLDSAPRPAETGQSTISRGEGELVLVVDDEDGIREVLASWLRKHGYRVASCCDGVEALSWFKDHGSEAAIVVTDVDMPQLGGLGLIRALLQLRPDLRILSMSGLSGTHSESSDSREVRKISTAFLGKPFAAEEFLRTVYRVLHSNPADPPS